MENKVCETTMGQISRIEKFAQETTVHGISHICKSGDHYLAVRYLWLTVVMFMTTGCAFNMHRVITEYLRFFPSYLIIMIIHIPVFDLGVYHKAVILHRM